MRLLLRTVWKDTIVLRWWLLVWVAILAGWAVWRDHAAAVWDAAPVNEKPETAGTLMTVVLGCAAVLAARVMHTDALQCDTAFWRTRPTSRLRLGLAKVCFAMLWLIALPAGVEYALLEHWGWQPWLWPCVADWMISVTSVVIPALVAAAFVPASSLAVPLALGLAWMCHETRPGAHLGSPAGLTELAQPFVDYYWRMLLGIAVTLFAAAGRQIIALALCLFILTGLPRMKFLRLPERMMPGVPQNVPLTADVTMEVSSVRWPGQLGVYADALQAMPNLWVDAAGGEAVLQPENGDRAQHFPLQPQLPSFWRNEPGGSMFSAPPAFETARLLDRWPKMRPHFVQCPELKTEEGGTMTIPLQYGTLTDPVVVELPLKPGASWQHGPWRIKFLECRQAEDSKRTELLIATEGPHFGLGDWRASFQGSACATQLRYALLNRRLRKVITLNVNEVAALQDITVRTALHRRAGKTALWLTSSELMQAGIGDSDNPAMLSLDSEVLRDAVLVVMQWRIVRHGERNILLQPWPEPVSGDKVPSLAECSAKLAALKPPRESDPDALRRYIDDCLRYRTRPPETLKYLAAAGSGNFGVLAGRILAMPWYSGTGNGDERERLLDDLAASMAEPEHLPLMLQLLERGVPLPESLKKHAWFRAAALPRLEPLMDRYVYEAPLAHALIDLHDPAYHPALLAWCRSGDRYNLVYVMRRLKKEAGFPWKQAVGAVTEHRAVAGKSGRAWFALLAASAGLAGSTGEAAALFTMFPWTGVRDRGYSAQSFGELFDLLRAVCPACPADDEAALKWIAEHGRSLTWDGKQWVLP